LAHEGGEVVSYASSGDKSLYSLLQKMLLLVLDKEMDINYNLPYRTTRQ